ncbi:MAG: hypothetical protein K9N06_03940 [Candidatus Cloacimonetes bacterium]|nr:hypothetical protein [Candidatus Cloacimonadota bacterium]
MYYSELLSNLAKQEKSPVNKMYLGELHLRWKNFQELIEVPDSSNASLADALSQFLLTLHNKKFIFNKARNTGFHHTSPLFAAYYLHDLISALMIRKEIIKEPGMNWGFNSFSYDFTLTGSNPLENSINPEISKLQTPPVLSLTQKIEFQYRIAGKRNFIKTDVILPYLLFFAYKNPRAEHMFMIEHYAALAARMSRVARVFVICESISDCYCNFSEDLPISIFVLQDNKRNISKNAISVDVLDKLEAAVTEALNPKVADNTFLQKRIMTAAPKPEKKPAQKPVRKTMKRIPRSMQK